MPVYTIENIDTGETEDVMMSYSEFEVLLKENKKIRHVIKPIAVVDAIRTGVSKPPADFQKHVIGRIKDKHPLGKYEKRWQLAKEI